MVAGADPQADCLGKESAKTPLNWAIWAQNIDEFRLGHSTTLY